MAHEIFGERFYSLREPAWHQLGIVAEEESAATEVLELLREPIVTLEPLRVRLRDGEEIELAHRAILRHPTDDDPEAKVFGIVGPEYHLLTAGEICLIWDEYVARPVETAGFLRGGSTFFLTSRLPAIDIRGDEVEIYLGAAAPMDGEHAASCEIWPLRVVCANTLRFAQERAHSAGTPATHPVTGVPALSASRGEADPPHIGRWRGLPSSPPAAAGRRRRLLVPESALRTKILQVCGTPSSRSAMTRARECAWASGSRGCSTRPRSRPPC